MEGLSTLCLLRAAVTTPRLPPAPRRGSLPPTTRLLRRFRTSEPPLGPCSEARARVTTRLWCGQLYRNDPSVDPRPWYNLAFALAVLALVVLAITLARQICWMLRTSASESSWRIGDDRGL